MFLHASAGDVHLLLHSFFFAFISHCVYGYIIHSNRFSFGWHHCFFLCRNIYHTMYLRNIFLIPIVSGAAIPLSFFTHFIRIACSAVSEAIASFGVEMSKIAFAGRLLCVYLLHEKINCS